MIFRLITLLAIKVIAYELAVCTIFHNEAKYLAEWIEFHLEQGVEHFYLYNNLSTDDFAEVLKPFQKVITLVDWPYEYSEIKEWNAIQCGAYKDCVRKRQRNNKWVAFLDTDEFLFNPDFQPLPKVLEEYEPYGAVGVHWVCYGTSNVSVPEGERLLDHLVMRAPLDFSWNQHFKTIAQIRSVADVTNPHHCLLRKGCFIVDENKEDTQGSHISGKISVGKLRINHYWSRDLDYFHRVKLERRERWKDETSIQSESKMNDVFDPILSKKLSMK